MCIVLVQKKRVFSRNQRSEDSQMIDWDHAYGKKPQWQGQPHCKHCYREGFFDAGVSGLLIIILMILAYGAEVMQ